MEDRSLPFALRYPWTAAINREPHALRRRAVKVPPMSPGDVSEPDELVRGYVSDLWAEDWQSPEDAYDHA